MGEWRDHDWLGDVEPAQQPRSASCGPAPDPSVPGNSLFATCDYHLSGFCGLRSLGEDDGPAPAAASGTRTSRRIVKRHKRIKGQPPMRFDSLSHETLLQRHERAAFSNKQEPWTVLTPQRVATSIEPATGHPSRWFVDSRETVRLRLRRTQFMVEVERIYGDRVNLFGAILGRISRPNKLPLQR
jgi:hypothetical protein